MKKIITAFILWASILVFASLTAHGQETVLLPDTNFRGQTQIIPSINSDWDKSSYSYIDSNEINNIMFQKITEITSWQSKNGDYCEVEKFKDGMYITVSKTDFFCFISIYDNGDGFWLDGLESGEKSIASDGYEKFMKALQSTIKVMCEIQMKVYHEQLYNKK